jgi:hypothetical protein
MVTNRQIASSCRFSGGTRRLVIFAATLCFHATMSYFKALKVIVAG